MAFLPAVSIVASAAGAAVQGLSSYMMGNYQAKVASNNAEIAQWNSEYATTKGQINAENQGLKTGAIVGRQKATQAASGVDVNVGSPAAVRASTEELGRMDALTIMNNAQREAFGYQVEKSNYLAEAKLDKMKANFGAISSLLGGASNVGDKWLSYQKAGWYA